MPLISSLTARWRPLVPLLILALFLTTLLPSARAQTEQDAPFLVSGSLHDPQGQAMLAELLQEAGLPEMIIAHDGEIVETYRQRL